MVGVASNRGQGGDIGRGRPPSPSARPIRNRLRFARLVRQVAQAAGGDRALGRAAGLDNRLIGRWQNPRNPRREVEQTSYQKLRKAALRIARTADDRYRWAAQLAECLPLPTFLPVALPTPGPLAPHSPEALEVRARPGRVSVRELAKFFPKGHWVLVTAKTADYLAQRGLPFARMEASGNVSVMRE